MRCLPALALKLALKLALELVLGLGALAVQPLARAQPPAPAGLPSQASAAATAATSATAASGLAGSALVVVDQALPQPLTATAGDATRGRAIVANRQVGLCLLCHTGPIPEERFQGNLAPDLAGAGKRWSAAQLRLRLVDARRLNPQTIMPTYHRTDGMNRVAPAFAAAPMLAAQQVEDVVAYLLTLRD